MHSNVGNKIDEWSSNYTSEKWKKFRFRFCWKKVGLVRLKIEFEYRGKTSKIHVLEFVDQQVTDVSIKFVNYSIQNFTKCTRLSEETLIAEIKPVVTENKDFDCRKEYLTTAVSIFGNVRILKTGTKNLTSSSKCTLRKYIFCWESQW